MTKEREERPQRGKHGSSELTELQLEERAFRERWPIPPEKRCAIVEKAIEIVLDNDEASLRVKVAAMRVLKAFDQLNMEQEKRDQGLPDVQVEHTGEVTHNHEVIQRALEKIRSTPGAEEQLNELAKKISRN